jgi:hypothetical protein
MLEREDRGLVIWRTGGFTIHYLSQSGKKQKLRKPFLVEQQDCVHSIERALKSARRAWNALDRSEFDRIPHRLL